MREKQGSLVSGVKKLSIMPLICLGVCVLVITGRTVYDSIRSEAREGLHNLAYALYEMQGLAGGGKQEQVNADNEIGISLTGKNQELLERMKEVCGVDATVFSGNTRIWTTVQNQDGQYAVGTKAADQVVQAALVEGKEYFSDCVMVNGTPYFGYYIPLQDETQKVIGMVFVGKPRKLMLNMVLKAMGVIFLAMTGIIAVTASVSMYYGKHIIYSLNKIREFLRSVAQGNVDVTMDPYLLERNDEIGDMGRFAVVLQKSITELVGTDSLTGLFNRRSCALFLANAWKEYQQYGTPFTIAMGI